MKNLFCYAFVALSCAAVLQSCVRNIDPEMQTRYELLQGTWETVHEEGHEYSTDAATGETVTHDDYSEDITGPSDESYMKLQFDRNNMVTILEIGTAGLLDTTLPASFTYSFNGSQIGGTLFCGDFVNYMNIVSLDGNEMVLELSEKGYDEETDTNDDNYMLTTYRKVNE